MKTWKGLILAGGTGSRLSPISKVVNKHLLPVYDKPMIFYPLTTLMLSGIREFVIVTTPEAILDFEQLMGDGSQWGISIVYRVQSEPRGIADGFRVAEDDLEGHAIALILGDNVFYGSALGSVLHQAASTAEGAVTFCYEVANASDFGVVNFDEQGTPVSIQEKPKNPTSNFALTGLYFYPPDVLDLARKLKPSERGELEISDINQGYLDQGRMNVIKLGRGIAWLDGGTCEALFEASQFVRIIEERTGLKIASPEEIALRLGLVDHAAFDDLVRRLPESSYKEYLANISA